MSMSSEPSAIKEQAKRMKQCSECNVSQAELGRIFQICSRCMGERYCSPECQKKNWPKHKAKCNANAANNKRLVDMAKEAGRSPTELTTLNEQLHGFLSHYRPLLVDIAKYAIDLFPLPRSGFVIPKQYVEIKLIPKIAAETISDPKLKGKEAFALGDIYVQDVETMPEGLRPGWAKMIAEYEDAKGRYRCCTAVMLVASCAMITRSTSWGITEEDRGSEKVMEFWQDLLEIAMAEGIEGINRENYT